MTKKKLALSKGGFSLAILLVFAAFFVFFFTYGQTAFQRAADKLGQEQTMGGLGPAFALVFCLVAVVCLALPALLCIIACIGNFAGKGNKLVAFTVVSLIAEIAAIALLVFLSALFMDGTLYDGVVIAVTAVLDVSVLASFVHSIVVLAKQKNATEE